VEKLSNDAENEEEKETYEYLDCSCLGEVDKDPVYEESYNQYVYYVPERYLWEGL